MAEANSKWSKEKIEVALSRESGMSLKVSRALGNLTAPFTALVLIDAKDYVEVKTQVIDKYGTKTEIIFIALNTGFQKIKQDFEKRERKTDGIYFIDMMSLESGAKIVEAENVNYLLGPQELGEAILAVEKKLESANKDVLVLLDSISTMLIYNSPQAVEKFTHTLLAKVNDHDASAIVFSSDFDEKDAITSTIGQFFDKTIKI